jgi:hypothetical protein
MERSQTSLRKDSRVTLIRERQRGVLLAAQKLAPQLCGDHGRLRGFDGNSEETQRWSLHERDILQPRFFIDALEGLLL